MSIAGCDSNVDGSAGSQTPGAPIEYVDMMTSEIRLGATVESLDDLTAKVAVRLSDNSIEKLLTY